VNDANRLQVSEMFAQKTYTDYKEKRQAFLEATNSDPALRERVFRSANPGEEMYQYGKSILFYKEHGADPESIVKSVTKKVEGDLRTKIKAEVEQEFLGKVREKNNQPTNLLGNRAANGAAAPDWKPAGLTDLLLR
jgi:hypothetical protein